MDKMKELLEELYESLRATREVHEHLLMCAYCTASIHTSRLGKAMSDVHFYLLENPDG